jgi:hypothetical protein
MSVVAVRALQPDDAGAARALVLAQFSATKYESRIREQLEIALRGDDAECRGIVAVRPGEARVRALALSGTIAGAPEVVNLHALVGDDRDGMRMLAVAVRDADARLIVCEMPDDAPFNVTVQVLRELGYEQEGRVADFVRDGVDLILFTWRSR